MVSWQVRVKEKTFTENVPKYKTWPYDSSAENLSRSCFQDWVQTPKQNSLVTRPFTIWFNFCNDILSQPNFSHVHPRAYSARMFSFTLGLCTNCFFLPLFISLDLDSLSGFHFESSSSRNLYWSLRWDWLPLWCVPHRVVYHTLFLFPLLDCVLLEVEDLFYLSLYP